MNEPNITREIEEGQLWSLVHKNGETVVAHILQKFYDTTWRLRFEDEGRVLRLWTCGYIKSATRLDHGAEKLDFLEPPTETPKEEHHIKQTMTSKKPPTIANIEEGELWKIQHQNGESVVARIDRRYHLDGDWHLRFVDEDNCTRTWPCSKIQFVWHLDFLEKEHRCTQEAPSPPKEHMNAELFCKNAMAFINSAYKGHRVLVEFNVFHAQEKTKDGDPSMLMECTWSNLVK